MLFTTLCWVVAVALTSSRGLDPTDESGYLLAYRWWDENLRTFTWSQFIYGPVFELLGYNIPALRVVRLVSVVSVMVVFGWAAMLWLRERRPQAPATRLWEIAGILTVTASGGMVYSWLPLSPGYNDLALLCSLLLAAIVMLAARAYERDANVSWWWPLIFGVVAAVLLMAKWSSGVLVIAMVGLVALVLLWRIGAAKLLRLVLLVALGAAAVSLTVAMVVPIGQAVSQFIETTNLVATSANQSNSPLALMRMYLDTGMVPLQSAVTYFYVMISAPVLGVLLTQRFGRLFALAVAIVGIAIYVGLVVSLPWFLGGAAKISGYSVAFAGITITAVVMTIAVIVRGRWVRRRGQLSPRSQSGGVVVKRQLRRRGSPGELVADSWRTWLVVAMLALLPWLQGIGTGNALQFMGLNGAAAWVVVLLVLMTGVDDSPPAIKIIAGFLVAATALLSTAVGVTGVWLRPYRTAPSALATTPVTGIEAFRGLHLIPETAAGYASLYALLSPYAPTPGTYVMAFDELPAAALILEGKPVGEVWYSALDRRRTAAGIKAACVQGPPWGERLPIIIYVRPPSPVEREALAACGLSIERDYRPVLPTGGDQDIVILVPKSAPTEQVPQ